jgi:TonB family protein
VPAPSAADASTDPRGGRVYLLSEVDVRPELQNRREVPQLIRANYPSLLRDAGIEGTVVARWVLGVDGRPERSSIRVVSATHPDFAFGGEQVAARMRFSPAQVNGKAVRVEVTLPISFTVH